MRGLVQDDTELFKQFMDNESFKQWLTKTRTNRLMAVAGAGGIEREVEP